MPKQDRTGPRGLGRGRGQGSGPCGGGRMRAGRGVGRRGTLAAGETATRHPQSHAPAAQPLSEQIAQLRARLAQLETGGTSDTP
jgi:hypothetical protein